MKNDIRIHISKDEMRRMAVKAQRKANRLCGNYPTKVHEKNLSRQKEKQEAIRDQIS